jgi:hypothetical protein
MEIRSPTSVAFPLQDNSTILLAGPSRSGKSTFVKKLLYNKKDMFVIEPTAVLYCYGIWSSSYGALERDINNLQTHEGLPNKDYIENFARAEGHKILIMDDLMEEVSKSSWIEKLFTRMSHHLNMTVVLITQNLFPKSKVMRTISLNMSYIIIHKSVRDELQVGFLGSQIGARKTLIEAYCDATRTPHGYLLVDLTAACEREYRFRTNIFTNEDCIVYV